MKKKKLLRLLSGLTIVSVLATSVPVYAVENENNNFNQESDSSGDTSFSTEIDSTFSLTVPKLVKLSANDKKEYDTTFNVTMHKADIRPTEAVVVSVPESFNLNRKGTDDVKAIANDLDTSDDGSQTEVSYVGQVKDSTYTSYINAGELQSGDWSGAINFNVKLEDVSKSLTMERSNYVVGSSGSTDLEIYYNGENVAPLCDYSMDNDNVVIRNGVVVAKAGAKVGDTTNVTASYTPEAEVGFVDNILNKLGLIDIVYADRVVTTEFTVKIVDIDLTSDESILEGISLTSGDSVEISANILGGEGVVDWKVTANSGVGIQKNGNKVKIVTTEDYVGTFFLVATYGDYAKFIPVSVGAKHEHSYIESITTEPTCISAGVKTMTCSCGESYTEEIPVAIDAHYNLSEAKVEGYTPSTHVADGHYDSVIYCNDCNSEISRTACVVEKGQHVSSAPVEENRVEPTCDKEGHYDSVVYCASSASECGSSTKVELSRETIIIPATGDHTAGTPVKENETDKSYDMVTYCTSCGHKMSTETVNKPQVVVKETSALSEEEITNIVNAYYNDEISIDDIKAKWSVGDTMSFTINGAVQEFVILDFEHDDLVTPINGHNKALLTVQTKNTIVNQEMNSDYTNVGGWNDSEMRVYCNNNLYNSLSCKGLVKQVTKKTSEGNKSSKITTSNDYVFLLSEIETLGSKSYSFAGEGSKYAFYSNNASRVKLGTKDYWSLRSPFYGSSFNFCLVFSDGSFGHGSADVNRGVAPAFCL